MCIHVAAYILLSGVLLIYNGFKILFKRFEQNINLENGKRIFPSPPCLGLGPFLHPPLGLLLLLPLSSLHGPPRGPAPARLSGPRPHASPSPQPLIGRPRAPASLPGGARRSAPSPTLSLSRTRSECNQIARL